VTKTLFSPTSTISSFNILPNQNKPVDTKYRLFPLSETNTSWDPLGYIIQKVVDTYSLLSITKGVQVLLSKIQSFSELQHNWNGYNASPISKSVISRTIPIILSSTEHKPLIYPTGRQSIQLEFYHNNNSLEIEIDETEIGLVCFNEKIFRYEKENLTEKELQQEITNFYGL